MTNVAHPLAVTATLTIEEVAAQLGYTDRHVRNLVRQRRLGSVKIGHKRRFTQAHVDAFRATYLSAIEVPAAHMPPVGTRLAA
jgi:excisionase family DNA binding protein